MVAGSSLFRRSCSSGWVVGGVVVLFVLVGSDSLVCCGSKIGCLFVRVLQGFFRRVPFPSWGSVVQIGARVRQDLLVSRSRPLSC